MHLLIFLAVCLLVSFVAVLVFNLFLMLLVGLYYFIKENIMYLVKVRRKKKLIKQANQIRSQIIEAMAKCQLDFANKNQDLAFKSGCEDITKFQKGDGTLSGSGALKVVITNGPKAEGIKKAKKEVAKKKIVKKPIKK